VNPVILILSCNAFRTSGHNRAIRETWLQEWGHLVPYKFLIGRGCTDPADDELVVNEADDFKNTIWKCRAAQRWANDNGFSHLFLCCADTYVVIPRLLDSGFANSDCIGSLIGEDYPGGGCGYWLSARANDAMFCDDIRRYAGNELTNHDLWTGRALRAAGLSIQNDNRYWTNQGLPGLFPYASDIWRSGIIAAHLGQCPDWGVRSTYKPNDMRACHWCYMHSEGSCTSSIPHSQSVPSKDAPSE
jgi:hypothetical protein